tara:strand:+ start:7383 stop:9482 length:2100 start_codon:yes stop_codon:yes gene_type:complete
MKNVLEVGSDFSGVGAFNQSLIELGVEYKEVFACDMDKYARKTFIENHGTDEDIIIVNSKEHDKVCDEMARLVSGKTVLSKPLLKKFLERVEVLARSFSFYYPLNVNYREIPEKPLGIYMTSPPCQGFSMAGKREGSNLFLNSLQFIKVNKPRYFIFENVKGLLSHEKVDKNAEFGKTFNLWLNYLGGKSVNGNPVVFPYEDSVPYHIYYQVLNAKDYGVPQNRERVFIIGIRDDADNVFHFPPAQQLKTKLKDVLEPDVDDKYYLSDEMIKGFIKSSEKHEEKGTGFTWNPKDLEKDEVANCLRANASLCKTDNSIKVGYINQDTQASKVFSDESSAPTIATGSKGYANGYVLVNSATPEGYEIAEPGDSINYQNKNSKTRRGCVGKELSSTLDTTCTVGVIVHDIPQKVKVRKYEVDILGLQKLLKNHKGRVYTIRKIAEQLNVTKTTVEHWFRTDAGFSIPDADIWDDLKSLLKITTDEFDKSIKEFIVKDNVFEKSISPTLTATSADEKILVEKEVKIGAIRGRADAGDKITQRLEVNSSGNSNALTTVQKDNVVIESGIWRTHKDGRGFRKIADGNAPTIAARAREDGSGQPVIKISDKENIKIRGGLQKNAAEMVNVSPCLTSAMGLGGGHVPLMLNYQIRRLTPRECFRLMGFPDTFKLPCSDTQTYKQAGNSIVKHVLVAQISRFIGVSGK